MKLTLPDQVGKREIFHINPVLQTVLYLPLAMPVFPHLQSVTLEQATPMPPALLFVMLCLAVCLYRFLRMTVILSEQGIEFRGALLESFDLKWSEISAVRISGEQGQVSHALLVQSAEGWKRLPLFFWCRKATPLTQAVRCLQPNAGSVEPHLLAGVRRYRPDIEAASAEVESEVYRKELGSLDLGNRAGYVAMAMAVLCVVSIFLPMVNGTVNLEHPGFYWALLIFFGLGFFPALEFIRREKPGFGAVLVAGLFGLSMALAGNLGLHLSMKFVGETVKVTYRLEKTEKDRQIWQSVTPGFPVLENNGFSGDFRYTEVGLERKMTLVRGPFGIVDIPLGDLQALHRH
ncbi:MAG TPA: hypothetical protein VFW42_01865 [Fluviicoccus sp.]|nr:hypothetical protein [Fluviicoccus sp.]